jgi:hypothetical protein
MTKYLDKIDDEEVAFLRNYFMVTIPSDISGYHLRVVWTTS